MLLALFNTLRAKALSASRISWLWRGLALVVVMGAVAAVALLKAKKDRELAKLRLERDTLKLKAESAEYRASSAPLQADIAVAQEEAAQARAELSGVEVALDRVERTAEAER